MIKSLIIDDEISAIEVLQHHVKKVDYISLIAATQNSIEGLDIIRREQIDLVFLDIQMPDITGLEMARLINNKCKIIFTTAHMEYAFDGYEFGVLDFLLKPISLPRFLKAMERIRDLLNTPRSGEGKFFLVKSGAKGRMIKVFLHEIFYLENVKNYVIIHHGTQKTLVAGSIADFEPKLPQPAFLRIHRSFIIATEKIISIDAETANLGEGMSQIPIGYHYREHFLSQMKHKMF
ncbi:LytR/AlgR family response regulator transcription factor [Chitinophaga vietnamensis]|uniref:LytR/AlgR family response regulator transcription factor n=1 Tax=Chitinophaga vietnamensis TaxID=2593957 RepID=UPI0011775185|nr:LytTR family DNA-binding domain-containing protein [Chitinophaga vietnamensis]